MADSIDTSGKSSIEILKGERHDMIAQAIFNILSTEIAQSTFAQIVDGLPLPSVLEDTYGGSDLEPDHPLFSHESLCPGVLQKTKELLEKFEVKNLKFDTSVEHVHNHSTTTLRHLTSPSFFALSRRTNQDQARSKPASLN